MRALPLFVAFSALFCASLAYDNGPSVAMELRRYDRPRCQAWRTRHRVAGTRGAPTMHGESRAALPRRAIPECRAAERSTSAPSRRSRASPGQWSRMYDARDVATSHRSPCARVLAHARAVRRACRSLATSTSTWTTGLTAAATLARPRRHDALSVWLSRARAQLVGEGARRQRALAARPAAVPLGHEGGRRLRPQ